MDESQLPTRSVAESLGFPPYYFSIRSVANGRLWDVSEMSVDDGARIHLWKEKEKSLVEDLRDTKADNQVFFIDYTGTLCSKASGHAVDIEDGRIVLRHRRPQILPFPSAYSHPFPKFAYDSTSGQIHIRFASDPSYPPTSPAMTDTMPNRGASTRWKEKQYMVTSVPKRKVATAFENATQWVSGGLVGAVALLSPSLSASGTPGTFPGGVSGHGATPGSALRESFSADEEDGYFDLRENEILEEERPESSEVDDSLETGRDVCVISLPYSATPESDHPSAAGAKARERRKWEVLPITRGKATFRSPTVKTLHVATLQLPPARRG